MKKGKSFHSYDGNLLFVGDFRNEYRQYHENSTTRESYEESGYVYVCYVLRKYYQKRMYLTIPH